MQLTYLVLVLITLNQPTPLVCITSFVLASLPYLLSLGQTDQLSLSQLNVSYFVLVSLQSLVVVLLV